VVELFERVVDVPSSDHVNEPTPRASLPGVCQVEYPDEQTDQRRTQQRAMAIP
jgi:hypothetical protein